MYLAKDDDWTTLEDILLKWCKASGAKFNIEKTVILPIGSSSHRRQVIASRKIGRNNTAFPNSAAVVQDGTTTRALGAQIGNKGNHKLVWDGIAEKTSKVLDMISRLNPPLQGIRIGAQTYGVSRTQFMTAADGMPSGVEEKLDSLFIDFFWQGKRPKVNKEYLKLPLDEGGQNWVDFEKCTDAIALMMLRTFLGVDNRRPKWAKVARSLMRRLRTTEYKRIPEGVLVDPIVQTWDTKLAKLPLDLQRMLTVAKRYDLVIDALNVSEEMKRSMPAFLHHGWDKQYMRITNVGASKCLHKNHNMATVGDLVDFLDGEDDAEGRAPCEDIRRCKEQAASLLNGLDPKWDPRIPLPDLQAPPPEDEEGDDSDGEFLKHRPPASRTESAFRILGGGISNRAETQYMPQPRLREERIVAYT